MSNLKQEELSSVHGGVILYPRSDIVQNLWNKLSDADSLAFTEKAALAHVLTLVDALDTAASAMEAFNNTNNPLEKLKHAAAFTASEAAGATALLSLSPAAITLLGSLAGRCGAQVVIDGINRLQGK